MKYLLKILIIGEQINQEDDLEDKNREKSKVKNSDDPSVSSIKESSYSDSSNNWNNSSLDKHKVTSNSSSSKESYAKMGGEKDISKFDGNKDKCKPLMELWTSHCIRTNFSGIKNITRHPNYSLLRRNDPKNQHNAKNKLVKKLLK